MADDPRKTEHEARLKALSEANAETAKGQALPPTPTQNENDLLALGLMHPDEKHSGVPTGGTRHGSAAHTETETHRAATAETTSSRRG